MKPKCFIFDMDGTLFDTEYDWVRIKEELNTQGKPILSYLKSLKEPEKSLKWGILEKHEKKATRNAVLKKGILEYLNFLRERAILQALVTNNSMENVEFLLSKFNLKFDFVISRERGLWKPSGGPFLEVMKKLKVKRQECCVIGDSHFDILAANEAGIECIFILNEEKERFSSTNAEVFNSVEALRRRTIDLLQARV